MLPCTMELVLSYKHSVATVSRMQKVHALKYLFYNGHGTLTNVKGRKCKKRREDLERCLNNLEDCLVFMFDCETDFYKDQSKN